MKSAMMFAVLLPLGLGGCAGWLTPSPPTTIVERSAVGPHFARECWTDGDPKTPAWIERDETKDTRLSDEMRREAANRAAAAAFAKAITSRRRVCAAGLKVLAGSQ